MEFNKDDPEDQGGTVFGTKVSFTVDLASGTVTQREIEEFTDLHLEMSDEEMVAAARALADIIRGAEDYYYSSHSTPSPAP